MPASSRHPRFYLIIAGLLLLAALSLGAPRPGASAAPDSLGWVGNMSPAGGSTTTITVGGNFTVYVQVWKDGVTNAAGQGANISCTLRYAPVGYFGGTWGSPTDVPMSYNVDIGNNDEYMGTINPAVGLYEFTAFCTDTGDNSSLFQGAGYGRLVVNTASGGCNSAAQSDNNVYWNGLLHDSFSSSYRSPAGPVTTAQGTVTLTFRTCMDDLNTRPRIRVWNDYTDSETLTNLDFAGHAADASLGGVTYWSTNLPIPASATILYYVFRADDGSATAYYRDDDPKFYGGGYGQAEASQSTAYNNSYQLTVYDPAFSVPQWMQRGVVYQVFPDRFRDGDPANNPPAGRFAYARTNGAITRSQFGGANPAGDWNFTVCDPRSLSTLNCADVDGGYYGDNFYGGDLQGILDKINDGYFDNLGVTVLYLNPIFRSPSNHKYDTADYLVIDPDFGDLATFQALATAANAHGIQLILDGVFNHTSSDSYYFDIYRRYDAAGNLTSPSGPGTDDQSGACESPVSPFRGWFYIPDIGTPGTGLTDRCDPNDADDPGGAWTQTYDAWYGYGSLPKLQANSTAVRNLVWNNGLSSVGPYWVSQGADGWRFDVGGDVDPGRTNNPANDYWEGFRSAVRAVNPNTITLGEEWGDASAWLLGSEWDSVMNYRFRSALLSWLFTGCSGSGCTGGTSFEDNDSNSGSSSGAISQINPSLFNARLMSIWEDYPPMALKAMMNLEGSHDTNRVRFLLKKINNNSDVAAVQRMKEWWLFAFTYPGAPTLYYGDEIGLNHDGVWATSKWEDDPYNRVPFPWPDASGSTYSYDATAQAADLQGFARHMASIRHGYRALQDGEVQHGLIIDDAKQVYGYGRTYGSGNDATTQTALIALNRSGSSQAVTFSNLNGAPLNLPNGKVLVDALTGTTYTVVGGQVAVTVPSSWGVVLLEQGAADTPAGPGNFSVVQGSAPAATYNLSWDSVTSDTGGGRELATYYTVHRDTTAGFTPTPANQLGTVLPPTYGSSNSRISYTDTTATGSAYYKVCAYNAAGIRSACTEAGPTALSLLAVDARAVSASLAWLLIPAGLLLTLLLYRRRRISG